MSEEKYPGWEQVQFVPQRDLADMTERGWRLLETDSANETVLVGKKRDVRIEELQKEIRRLRSDGLLSSATIDELQMELRSHKRKAREWEGSCEIARKNQKALAARVALMEEALQRFEVLLGAIREQYGQKALDELMPPVKVIYPDHLDDPKLKELVQKYAEGDATATRKYISDLKSRQKRSGNELQEAAYRRVCLGTQTGRFSSQKPNLANLPKSGRLNAYGQDIDDM
jgi:hypothetical protein